MVILKYYIGFMILFLFTSCASNNILPVDVEGNYVQNDLKNIKLQINKTSFILFDSNKQKHLTTFKCCDTITYGNWRIDKQGLLVLSTKDELNTLYLSMNVDEKIDSKNKDSITFIFNNPIEKHYKKFGEKYRELYYSINFYVNGDEINETSDDNPIKIIKTGRIKEFEITIKPKFNIPVRNLAIKEIHILPYEIKNVNSNVFIINIPKLNYGFLTYKRLYDDYIKIVTKNKLIWDRKKFIKK